VAFLSRGIQGHPCRFGSVSKHFGHKSTKNPMANDRVGAGSFACYGLDRVQMADSFVRDADLRKEGQILYR
jgi:hypothetical protein